LHIKNETVATKLRVLIGPINQSLVKQINWWGNIGQFACLSLCMNLVVRYMKVIKVRS